MTVSTRSSWRVLVVDDDALICGALQRMLAQLGAECDVASDGHAAVAAAARGCYDLILMDVNLPGLDGPGASRAILGACAPGEAPRIVGITGVVDEAERLECARAGMALVLEKPVRSAHLASLLTREGAASW